MTFRSRPVLDRRHRPRWQDELRTQQLTVVAFAVAIALALGIFGAAAWNGYWESHFRPVAAVAGTTYDRADLAVRERILTAEAVAEVTELQAQLGGPRDQIIQQQIDSLSLRFNSITNDAAQSLVDGATLAARADEFGVSVSEEELDRAKEYAVGARVIRRESNAALLSEMIEAWLFGRLAESAEFEGKIRAVTREQVRALAAACFDPGRRAEGVVRGR